MKHIVQNILQNNLKGTECSKKATATHLAKQQL